MKKTIFLFTSTLLLVWLGIAVNAHAYNEYGHYYTLLALFDSLPNAATPSERLREIKLEAFCTELPDLARELDAITQRAQVFKSWSDFQWGLRGHCSSPDSKLMVASQYYLHGLSGTPASKLRDAAIDIIKIINLELKKFKPAQRKEREPLICARGFADHLLGDSYAHVKLSSETRGYFDRLFNRIVNREMYDTGLGHTRDLTAPDLLYGHYTSIDRWPQWVHDAGKDIAPGADIMRVLAMVPDCSVKKDKCDEAYASNELENLKLMNTQLKVEIEELLKTGTKGIGNMERKFSCDQEMQKVFPDGPQCNEVWNKYLVIAIQAFYDKDIDPTFGSQASADKSCSAWHCEGKTGYGGQKPGHSCSVEIINEVTIGEKHK